MPNPNILFAGNVVVAGGPTVLLDHKITADAYEKIDFTLDANTKNREVNLQPGTEMHLVSINASWLGSDLSYSPKNDGSEPIFALDAPHTYLGGAVKALGDVKQQKLYFSNATNNANAKAAQVQILIARRAVT